MTLLDLLALTGVSIMDLDRMGWSKDQAFSVREHRAFWRGQFYHGLGETLRQHTGTEIRT